LSRYRRVESNMRRMRHRRDSSVLLLQALWTLSLGGALALAPAQLQAQSGLGLNWVRLPGAESCISASDLMNRIEARAERVLFVRAGEAALSIDGYVQPVAGPPAGWAVTLEVSDAEGHVLGHRDLGVLAGPDCTVVAGAALLIFDLTVDPDGVLDTGIPLSPDTRRLLDQLLKRDEIDPKPDELPVHHDQSAAPPPGRVAAPGKPARQREPEREPEPAPPLATTPASPTWLHLSALGSFGELPGVAWGLGVRATLPTTQGWLVELSLSAFPERPEPLEHAAGAEAGFSAQLGALALCPLRPTAALALCAGAEYGRQAIAPSGLAGPAEPADKALVNVLAYGLLRADLLGPLSVRASAAVVAPLLRNDYRYTAQPGEQRLFRMAPVAVRAEVGLGLGL
jgi:hypothetical protein